MSGEENMITITTILPESLFDDLMEKCECFSDLFWDVQYYDGEVEA